MLQGNERNAIDRLTAFIESQNLAMNSRLPPERDLAERLSLSRTTLRRALAVMESEGLVWRHVGRGTFLGPRPTQDAEDIAVLSGRTNPAQVMEARLLFEPGLARLAALHATGRDIAEMRRCTQRSRAASSWRVYEAWDTNLHRAVAQAAHNPLLLSLFDTMNLVRRQTAWGRLRTRKTPAPDHHSFGEHDALVDAIEDRDVDEAERRMRAHLTTVRNKLLDR
jgi:DNA-binding FadR family transcriptional regulator